MIGLIMYSARFLSPQVAGILTALPVIFLTSFTLGFNQKDVAEIQNYLLNTSVSATLTALFIIGYTTLNYYFPDTVFQTLFLSLACYLIAVFFYLKFY